MANGTISWGGVFLRIIGAAVLVFATYNPERYSYYHWAIAPVLDDAGSFGPAKFLVGTLLVVGWVVFLQATRRSIGVMGALLVSAVCAGVIWLLIERNLVSASSSRGIAHVVLIALAVILGVGMSWSHFSRRITGQTDTDIVN